MVVYFLQSLLASVPKDMILLIEIGILLIIATLIGFIMRILRQPLLPAYIITGILIGPLVLGLIKDQGLIISLSQIGVAFLIFTAGLEIKFNKLKEVGKVSSIGGIIQVVILFIITFIVSQILGFSGKAPVYIGLVVAFSSTMIVVKLLSDRDEMNSLHGRIIMGILVMQDIIAILALSILTGSTSFFELAILLIKIIIFAGVGFILSKVTGPIFRIAARSTEFLLVVSVSFLFLFVVGAYIGGLSIIIGAFFAGVVLANTAYKTEIEGKIAPLREFFALIFFVALGMQIRGISPGSIIALIVLIVLVIIIKPLVTMIIIRIFGYERKTSFLTGNAIAQTSEFSLIIVTLGFGFGQISGELFSLLVLLTVLTMYLTTYLIGYEKKLFYLFGGILNFLKLKEVIKESFDGDKQEIDIILFGCHRMGSLFLREFEKEKKKVLVIDYNPEIIKSLNERAIPCIYGDFANQEVFQRIDLKKVQLIISTIADLEDNLLLLKKVKRVNSKVLVFIVAKRISEAKTLYKAGADYVILPMIIGGQKGYELIKKIANNRELIKEIKKEHIRYLDSVHHILY